MIMIAGGSGRLGRILTSRFAERGEAVRILSRGTPRAGALTSPAVEFVAGDVRRQGDIDRAVRGARIVISAMSAFGVKGVTPREVDRDGNANLFSACERMGVEHVVLVSVRGASPDHPMELTRMKHAAEQALLRERHRHWRPENLSLVQFVAAFAAATGASGPVKHIPLAMLRLLSVLARPVNPTFARMVRASVVMDTTDMTFDPSALRRQFPDLTLSTVAEVACRDYGAHRASGAAA